MQITTQIAQRKYPEYKEAIDSILNGRESSGANMLIAAHGLYDSYCNWLFDILFEAEKYIDVSAYDAYHRRVYGFLSEILLNVWIYHNRFKVYETEIGITREKAETEELKQILAAKVKEYKYTEARNVYLETLKKRPDVALANSDLSSELRAIEIVLYILEKEEEERVVGLGGFSNDLKKLTDYYKYIEDVLCALEDGNADAEMLKYFIANRPSEIMLEAMLQFSQRIKYPDIVKKILKEP